MFDIADFAFILRRHAVTLRRFSRAATPAIEFRLR